MYFKVQYLFNKRSSWTPMDQPLKPKTFTNVISCAYYAVCNILMGFPPFTPRMRKNDPMKGGFLAWDHTQGHVLDRWWCMYLILKNMEGFMQHKYYKHGCLLFKKVGGEDGISFPFVYFFCFGNCECPNQLTFISTNPSRSWS